MLAKQIRLNLTQRQVDLLEQAIEKGLISNTSDGIRRGIDQFLDTLTSTGKIKEP